MSNIDQFSMYFSHVEFFAKVADSVWRNIRRPDRSVEELHFTMGDERSTFNCRSVSNREITLDACAAESVSLFSMPANLSIYWLLPYLKYSLIELDTIDDSDVDAAILKIVDAQIDNLGELVFICIEEYYKLREIKSVVFQIEPLGDCESFSKIRRSLSRRLNEST